MGMACNAADLSGRQSLLDQIPAIPLGVQLPGRVLGVLKGEQSVPDFFGMLRGLL